MYEFDPTFHAPYRVLVRHIEVVRWWETVGQYYSYLEDDDTDEESDSGE